MDARQIWRRGAGLAGTVFAGAAAVLVMAALVTMALVRFGAEPQSPAPDVRPVSVQEELPAAARVKPNGRPDVIKAPGNIKPTPTSPSR
jgi:hypothetical protein